MDLWRPTPQLEPVPDWLHDALEVVLTDFQQPTAIDLLIGYETAKTIMWFSEAGGSGSTGAGIPAAGVVTTPYLVDLADYLQEHFFLETRGAWGEARPRCPNHPHPAKAIEREGEGWWICPCDQRLIAPIGRFGREGPDTR